MQETAPRFAFFRSSSSCCSMQTVQPASHRCQPVRWVAVRAQTVFGSQTVRHRRGKQTVARGERVTDNHTRMYRTNRLGARGVCKEGICNLIGASSNFLNDFRLIRPIGSRPFPLTRAISAYLASSVRLGCPFLLCLVAFLPYSMIDKRPGVPIFLVVFANSRNFVQEFPNGRRK